eukprot:CAMPEP_0184666682 /NCGR_PEP_ID=MMETSP0308-20130426/63093_1 /TAXON_ID=38269 /ORGANISM="Gloeochaete witrockiana, Strain SAG 46.84" /LENGTH=369 /DNA_ID=CAMNT_0027111395 /DNA_START=243 /DNA_END=1352 /DNA_ORIENTATION=+
MSTLNVDLGDRSYPIYIGENLLNNAATLLRPFIKGKQVMIVTNTTIAPLYLKQVQDVLTSDGSLQVSKVVLPDGEEFKNLEVLNQIFTACLENRLDRKATLVALGGGVIGDMTGFAAATYMRGVNFIQIPTTLLSMVDSSVGGKTGVNHAMGKNMIGSFHQPQCVLADVTSLRTLPDRQLKAGIAEVIKYSFINDVPFLDWLEENMAKLLKQEPEALSYAIYWCCLRKAEIVGADEKESGQRALLNLGHTFGHAIENNMGYGEVLHGEAVAIGMCMAAKLSLQLGWISQDEFNRVVKVTEAAGLPTDPPRTLSADRFLGTMAVDKKVMDGEIRLVLLKGLGNALVTSECPSDVLVELVEEYLPRKVPVS